MSFPNATHFRLHPLHTAAADIFSRHRRRPTTIFRPPAASSASAVEQHSIHSSARVTARVVTFNVLSTKLATPTWFTSCSPEELDSELRLPRILAQLAPEVDARALVCLQEVSQAWAGPLYTFFLKRGYTFVYASYGGQHDGYMGVGIAVPLDCYDVAEVYVDRLADTIRWPCGDGKSESGSNSDDTAGDSTDDDGRVEVKGSFMGSLSSVDGDEGQSVGASAGSAVEATVNNRHPQRKRKVSRVAKKMAKKLIAGKARVGMQRKGFQERPTRLSEALDAMSISVSLKRQNCLVSVGLSCRESGASFSLSTYHMPCAFRNEPVMMVHSALALQRAAELASGRPYLVAGDFNVAPSSPIYALITGASPRGPTPAPRAISYSGWSSTVPDALRSAYAEVNGSEPEFTNYSVQPRQRFVDTLDYIFMSEGATATEVRALPNREEVGARGLPSATHPSDHLMLAATVHISVAVNMSDGAAGAGRAIVAME